MKRLDYCDSMDNVTSSYIEEPITVTWSALSGVSASQPSESDVGHSIDDCCSDDASSTDEGKHLLLIFKFTILLIVWGMF